MREIRTMNLDDLKLALLWAREEGWNIGEYDAEAYLNQDTEGFKMLYLDGKAIGCISVVKYTEKFGFIGLFIIRKEFRNQGHGTYLFKSELSTLKERLTPNSTVGLYAVPAKISTYQRFGFASSYTNHKWFIQKKQSNQLTVLSTFFQPIHTDNMEKISSYDRAINLLPRSSLLASILQQKHAKGFFYVKDNEIKGYGILRKCIQGYRLGPLYADSLDDAKALFEEFIKYIPDDEKIFLDIPNFNKFTLIFAKYFKLEEIKNEQTQAILDNFNSEEINHCNEKKYAICSLELS